jgi:hypothetical protein
MLLLKLQKILAGVDEIVGAGSVLIKREIPRLCRGGSSSLTFAGVHPRNSER